MTSSLLLIGLIWVVNFTISWWNARSTGLVWSEARQMGGFERIMAWSGAIMSAAGFSWCYLFVLLIGGYYAQPLFLHAGEKPILTQHAVEAGFSLGYLILIPLVLMTGLLIWVDSLVQAWRRRDMASMGTAAWNTFAQVHNSYSAMRGIPDAFQSVKEFFGSDDDDGDNEDSTKLVLLALVVAALLGGIFTTMALVKKYAGRRPVYNPGYETDIRAQRMKKYA